MGLSHVVSATVECYFAHVVAATAHLLSAVMRVTVWRRSKLSDCVSKQLKVLLLVTLVVFIVVPVRNVVFYIVIPGMWRQHSTLFLIKALLDGQHFPVEETPLGLSPIKLNVNINDIQTKFSDEEVFILYQERVKQLKEKSLSDTKAKIELKQLLKFEPQMSEHERAIVLFTLDTFVTACEVANLTYFLISGSALGAVRHHGMIPWDDDIDIMMNSSQWRKIRNVLGNIEGFELFTPSNVQWKFFMTSLPKGNRPFKWPNIDIFFFNEDSTHIWAQTWGSKASLLSPRSDIFPLKRRKFERWNLPAPRLMNMLVSEEFGDINLCKTATYNHRRNIVLSLGSVTDINCEKLHNVFPFVFHERNIPGVIVEVSKIGGKTVETIPVPVEVR